MSSGSELGDITQLQDFRDVLKQEFSRRSRKNSKYTLAAFAQYLGITPSRLHEVLAGRYGISQTVARDFAQKLKFSEFKTQYFCNLVASQHSRNEINKKLALLRLRELKEKAQFEKVALDVFAAISNWYYFAILELTTVAGFDSSPQWISTRLNVPVQDIRTAIQCLLRLKLLAENEGVLSATHDYSIVGENTPSSAIKQYHLQIMQKAQQALLAQPLDKREFLSLTLAIDDDKIPEAKMMLQEFQEKFCKTLGDSQTKKKVFCLAMQFFNIEGGHE